MRDFRDAKAMAQALRANLKDQDVTLSIAESLEITARMFGFDNWNVLAAKIAAADEPANAAPKDRAPPSEAIAFHETIPVIRMFDVAKASEFYGDFLGFTEDWRGEIFPGAPLYMQLSRGSLRLHLSEHHGDAAPGGTTVVRTTGIRALHQELNEKNYKYNHPGLEEASYGALVMTTHDPFGNRLRFEQEIAR
jgi:catechol 2,3-dioxygenase-like lactoylglutathione lyase family enzyme